MWLVKELGQFRAKGSGCPVCLSEDNGNWTCPPCKTLVNVHRELVRSLQSWRSLFEAQEVPDELVAADGRSYSLWDAQIFYTYRTVTPPRQQQAVQYFLFENMKEKDAAVRMGIAPDNPIGIYATLALTTMLTMASRGELPNYVIDLPQLTKVAS